MNEAACAAVEDREDEIEKACDLIERDLTILGATALEDKLQVGVPDAIAQLHRAGIKLWILTGQSLLIWPFPFLLQTLTSFVRSTRDDLRFQETSYKPRSKSDSVATSSRTRWTL